MNYKIAKNIITCTAIGIIILIIVFVCDVINEVPDWKWFNIDFSSSRVSNFGTLISGLLSFLAILFVIYNIIEQREIINRNEIRLQEDEDNDHKSRILIMNNLLNLMLREIKQIGIEMNGFHKKEVEKPTITNLMNFTPNNSFKRLSNIDYHKNYETFKYLFQSEEDWEKNFSNLYNYIDFYTESIQEIQSKNIYHNKDKYERQQEINDLCQKLTKLCSKQINIYLKIDGREKYLSNKWVQLCNNLIPVYYEYLQKCQDNKELTDFRIISDEIILPFLKNAVEIRKEYGLDEHHSEKLFNLGAEIRKKIFNLEYFSLQYAENIKIYHDKFYNSKSESYIEFKILIDNISPN